MKPKYAIVRVDMREQRDGHYYDCPEHFEKINGRFVCAHHYGKAYFPFETCDNCRYGDTKEQLIRKIETAVAIMRNKMENKEVYLDRAVATFIVEFLGVE